MVYLGLLFLTYWGMAHASTGFLPEQDQGYLLASVQLPDSASVQRTEAVMNKMDEIARHTPGVAHTVGVSGESFVLGTTAPTSARCSSSSTRSSGGTRADRYDAVIAKKIQQACTANIEGALVSVFRAPPIRGLGNAGGFQLQTEQRGFVDLNALQAQTDQLVAKANADPAFAGAFTQFRAATPQLFVDIDRAKVESLRCPSATSSRLYRSTWAACTSTSSTASAGPGRWSPRPAPRFRTNAAVLKQLQVAQRPGRDGPASARWRGSSNSAGPVVVMRYNMYTSAPVNGAFAARCQLRHRHRRKWPGWPGRCDVPFEWTGIDLPGVSRPATSPC